MAIHASSFLVGSMFSGIAFLAINQQLSYRERLTTKWPLREKLEEQLSQKWKSIMQDLRSERQHLAEASHIPPPASLKKQWNDKLDQVQRYFYKKE
mmetsp:Transcript_14508/g.35179  ORF Transcript_14508/g.35179 Transcript_14508/m.35179 type:complete len:96 (-) Transcript_14508:2466-2753(-)